MLAEISREIPGPSSAFSLEANELQAMVLAVRTVVKAVRQVLYRVSRDEIKSRVFRRSLFVVQDVQEGEAFTPQNVRSIRPGFGLHTRYLTEVLGRRAAQDMARGTPLAWDLVA